jgi:4-aminobutyrate aminotransferase-like enzyme
MTVYEPSLKNEMKLIFPNMEEKMEQLIQIEGEPKSNEIRKIAAKYIGKGHKTYTPTQVVTQKAAGVYLWNAEGRKLIDFAAGVLVANLGHNHPDFEAAYQKYTADMPRSSYNTFTEQEVYAAKRLIEKLDCPRLQKLLWADSGSAAIIKAMWASQHYQPDKHIIVATRYGFHGKKGLAGDTTGDKSANPNVRFISFPICDYCTLVPEEKKRQEEVCKPIYEAELRKLQEEYPNDIVLLITEPYLGAHGSFHPPKWYHQLLNRWCDENKVTFILDEVQSCYGRTGEMYAFQKYGIEPDIVVLGKGIGNGEPVAVAVGRAEIIDTLNYGEASDTYSGNPRACASILAVLDVYEKVPVVENCRKISPIIETGLNRLKNKFEFVTFVRGEGLVWGLEVKAYKGKSAAEIANECVYRCYLEGLHLMGPLAEKVLRISPPLIISEEVAQEGLQLMYNAFQKMV